MVDITEWMADRGKYAIMSTQAYVNKSGETGGKPIWFTTQSAMLSKTGAFYYLESLCPDFNVSKTRHWVSVEVQ